MTTIDTTTAFDITTCPSWCTNHLDADDVVDVCHEHPFAVGDEPRAVAIVLFPSDEEGVPSGLRPFIDMSNPQAFGSAHARELAAALLAAADKLDELEAGR